MVYATGQLFNACMPTPTCMLNHVYTLQVTIDLPEGFTPTCMAHPDTYLNKVVIGSQEGKLQLWNFLSGKMLYEFSGFGEGAVKCITPSPALDVVGVGLSAGCASATSFYCVAHASMVPVNKLARPNRDTLQLGTSTV